LNNTRVPGVPEPGPWRYRTSRPAQQGDRSGHRDFFRDRPL